MPERRVLGLNPLLMETKGFPSPVQWQHPASYRSVTPSPPMYVHTPDPGAHPSGQRAEAASRGTEVLPHPLPLLCALITSRFPGLSSSLSHSRQPLPSPPPPGPPLGVVSSVFPISQHWNAGNHPLGQELSGSLPRGGRRRGGACWRQGAVLQPRLEPRVDSLPGCAAGSAQSRLRLLELAGAPFYRWGDRGPGGDWLPPPRPRVSLSHVSRNPHCYPARQNPHTLTLGL